MVKVVEEVKVLAEGRVDFEPFFNTMREVVNADFEEVTELRNTVFHFRRGITPKDTDRLRRFLDRLRYDSELYSG